MLMRIERGGDGENSVLNFYDENGLLARQETKFTEIKILDVNTYNKNNDLEKVERIANYENGETENQTITYQYLEFDDNKNWIKRIRYSGYHFYTMETRTINYLKTK